MKTAIIVDSVGYLPEKLWEHPDIFKIDLSVNFSDGSVMIDSSNEIEIKAFYERLIQEKQLPTTSQPTVGAYYELMDQIVSKGYEAVFCVHLSSAISGTFQSALMVTNEYKDKIKVFCLDSRGASVTMEGQVRAILRLLEEGLDEQTIFDQVKWLAEQSRIYLMVEDLNNLVKGGRLSPTSALLGSVLQIRPLLYFDSEGKIVLFEKIRTNKKVFKRWSELVKASLEKYPQGVEIAFANAECYDEIKAVEAYVLSENPGVDSHILPLGPVVGTHVGKGAKGMAIIPKLENYKK